MFLKNSLMLSVSMLTLVYASDQCKSVHSVSDRILQGFVIRSISQKSVHSCIIECEEESNCFSTNYLFPNITCQLNSATAELHPDNFVSCQDAMYLKSLVRDESEAVKAGTSCDQTCGGLCVSVPGSFASTCVCLHSNPKDCQANACVPRALGMEDGRIKDNAISASTTHQQSSLKEARLNSGTAWTPLTDDDKQWLTVTFDSIKIVTKIATQGHKINWWWTKTYKIQYKHSGSWTDYIDNANNNIKIFSANTQKGDTIVNNSLTPPVITDSIRIRPETFSGRMALRIELYGCTT